MNSKVAITLFNDLTIEKIVPRLEAKKHLLAEWHRVSFFLTVKSY